LPNVALSGVISFGLLAVVLVFPGQTKQQPQPTFRTVRLVD
jgi:hypothetical protein